MEDNQRKEPYSNNYYCTEKDCNYETGCTTENEEEAEKKLLADGGYDNKTEAICPKCNRNALVFIPK